MVKGTLISLEVGYHHAETVNNAMLRCKFEEYTGVRYVPFTRHDDTYNIFMRKVLKFHQDIKMKLEVIRIPQFNYLLPNIQFKTDKFKSVRDIIMSYNNQHRDFVYDVDKGRGYSTAILYNIDAEEYLEDFIQGFKELLLTHIEKESFKKNVLLP